MPAISAQSAGTDLMLDVMPIAADDREDADWVQDSSDGHIH
jgi:hypothetical protein